MRENHTLYIGYIIATFLFLGCSELLVNEPDSTENITDFQSAWDIANTYYPFFEFKGIDWDSLYTVYYPQVLEAKGDEIYFILYDLFKELKDGHVEIHTQGGFSIPTYLWERNRDLKAFSPEVVRSYFDKPLKVTGNYKIAYELIDNLIGYIHLSTFTKGDWIHDIDKVLNYFKNTKGLVIDIRNNGGGSSITYDYMLSRFINEPIEETVFFKNGSQKSWWIYPGGVQYRGNVVILINGASFSASEIFPELMRQLPNVIVVGDTSGGGGGASEIFHLPSGKRLKLPVKYFKRLDGEMIEWNGIIPDIVVEQTETDIKLGREKKLEHSKTLLRNLNIKSANQNMERPGKAGA